MQKKKEVPTVDVAVENAPQKKVVFSPYWEKRKRKLKKEFIQKLQDSANSEVIASDEYGEYRVGTFLHLSLIHI